ncbi:DUF3558 domain-containing protein [Amycolatopsis azurea]|uniref:DUF3558 domain-containing protein n=1 Tax=Amycolatopsis azurea TaxID=36819 RepID=UPI0038305FDF
MIRCVVPVCAVVVVVGVLSACTGRAPGHGGTPSPGDSAARPSSSAPPALPYAGAPKVASPLPASVLAGDPCTDAFTPAQIDVLLGSPVKITPRKLPPLGDVCAFSNLERGGRIDVLFDTVTHSGLSKVYQNTKPKVGMFKPMADVQGFPTVAHSGQPGQKPDIDFCMVYVGLADDLDISVSLYLGQAKRGRVDPCDVAWQAADAAATTLKAKAGK